ncbi:MAG: hypothetical protein FJ398_24445 [Verrucomicrobia bacterium]|nr:hypothetical protein [Verrucomicrobiota bacterium]
MVARPNLCNTPRSRIRLGKVLEGILAYSMAVGNNPGDRALDRGFLKEIQESAEPPQFQGPGLSGCCV